jgi:hypothetical protein
VFNKKIKEIDSLLQAENTAENIDITEIFESTLTSIKLFDGSKGFGGNIGTK